MIQTIISGPTYQANILAALQQTGITNTTAGGKARAFCDIVGDQIGLLDANKANDIAQSLLPYAIGSNLDLIGQIFGVPRLAAVNAFSAASDSNFQFYVQSGTFGSINQGSLSMGEQNKLARLSLGTRRGVPLAEVPGPAVARKDAVRRLLAVRFGVGSRAL